MATHLGVLQDVKCRQLGWLPLAVQGMQLGQRCTSGSLAGNQQV